MIEKSYIYVSSSFISLKLFWYIFFVSAHTSPMIKGVSILNEPVIYIKAEQSNYLGTPVVRIQDIASVYCKNKKIEDAVNNIEIYKFDKNKDGRAFISILILIREISKIVPYGEVKSLGEEDIIIYYKDNEKGESKWLRFGKIFFICITCFLGTGISIMGYNNDVDMAKIFAQLYETFTGTKAAGPTFIELFYSIGLTVGIFIFFNHIPGKRVVNEPTPIQVQMRLYEQDVNQTFILGASRKGEELDVDHK